MAENDTFAKLSAAIGDARTAANRQRGFTNRFIAGTENLSGLRARLGASASLRSARALSENPAFSFGDTLANSLRTAKARQGILNRGDAAIRQQQLRDRLEIARRGISQRARGIGALSDAANIREGVNLARAAADDASRASRISLGAGLLGAAAGAYRNRDTLFGKVEEIDLSTLPKRRGGT